MSIKVVGNTAYELIYGYPPLTDEQADALVAELSKVGYRYKKCVWREKICLITKMPAEEYEALEGSTNWRSVKERAGYNGTFTVQRNAYMPGKASFSPGADWNSIVTFIDTNFPANSESKVQKRKKWWEFWK